MGSIWVVNYSTFKKKSWMLGMDKLIPEIQIICYEEELCNYFHLLRDVYTIHCTALQCERIMLDADPPSRFKPDHQVLDRQSISVSHTCCRS